MRICAISLPELRVELVRLEGTPELAAAPLAVVVAAPPLTEQKLLGGTRLDVVSAEALALGVRPGHTIAQARARAGALSVRVVRPDSVRSVLARLAEAALAFGATVSFHMAGDTSRVSAAEGPPALGDVVWVDVTGCAHLHAPDQATGEARLAARLLHVIEGLGHRCAAAVADGPRVAALLAHATAFASADPRATGAPRVVVVPPGGNRAAIAPLPVGLLPLPETDVRWLAKLGVRTVAELAALPRSALATRLGARARVVLGLAEGEDRAPLTGYVPPEVPEETTTLEYGVESTSALLFVAKTLTDRLGMRLAGRAVATARLELELQLDAGMLASAEGEGSASRIELVAADLPAPLSAASDLLAALRPKLEQLVLRAPVLGAKLRAPSLVHKPAAALSLFDPQPRAARALPRLVAELAGDLGPEAVGRLAVGDAWAPEERSVFVPLGTQLRDAEGGSDLATLGEKPSPALRTGRKRRHLLSSVPEPTRVLPVPVPIARESLKIVRHLTRLEAVAWWKMLPGDKPRARGVDHVQAWTEDGPAWIEIDRASGATRLRGWFD